MKPARSEICIGIIGITNADTPAQCALRVTWGGWAPAKWVNFTVELDQRITYRADGWPTADVVKAISRRAPDMAEGGSIKMSEILATTT